MADAPLRPGTEAAAYVKTMYDADFRLKAYEDSVIVADFDMPQGVDKIGNSLVIRIVPTIAAQSLTSTGTGIALNYDGTTATSVSCNPVGRYGAVEIPIHLVAKMANGEETALKTAYRNQLMGSVKESFDAYAGSTLGPGLSNTKGPANFDKTSLLDAKQTLRINAKSHYNMKTSQVFVKYHPSQVKYLESITEIMNADARGDSENPNVAGFVVKAWGMTFGESGNIYSAAGVVYNILHLKSAFVRGYNQPAFLLDPQPFELVTRFISYLEGGVVEVFDEDGILFKSAA
jgi:hypothetical protein